MQVIVTGFDPAYIESFFVDPDYFFRVPVSVEAAGPQMFAEAIISRDTNRIVTSLVSAMALKGLTVANNDIIVINAHGDGIGVRSFRVGLREPVQTAPASSQAH